MTPTRRDVLSMLALAAAAPAAARGASLPSIGAVSPLEAQAFHPRRALDCIEALCAIGKDAGMPILRAHAAQPDQGGLFAVIRSLVVLPAGDTLRPPMLGAPVPAPPSALHAPRYPVVLLSDVPLVVVSGYMLGGQPEPLSMHLDALAEYPWRTTPWKPAPAEAVRGQLVAAPWWEGCGVQAALLSQLQRYADG